MYSVPEQAGAVLDAVAGAVLRVEGRPPVILVDGPSGAGKSSLADLLIRVWPCAGPGRAAPRLIRMDDLYPGWNGLEQGSAALGCELLAPLRESRTGRWRCWDWAAGRPTEWHRLDADAPLVVEGCGTLARANVALADLAIWLVADDPLRKQRALTRDGRAFETHWDQWQRDFDRYAVRERPRTNAGLVLDVTDWPISTERGASPAANVVS